MLPLFFFVFPENVSEILDDELVNVWNNFHYITRNTETTLRCSDKIFLAIYSDPIM